MNPTQVLELCKRLRQMGSSSELVLDPAQPVETCCPRLFQYLEYCELDILEWIRNYLSTLQPYMIQPSVEGDDANCVICILDGLYHTGMKLRWEDGRKLVISFQENLPGDQPEVNAIACEDCYLVDYRIMEGRFLDAGNSLLEVLNGSESTALAPAQKRIGSPFTPCAEHTLADLRLLMDASRSSTSPEYRRMIGAVLYTYVIHLKPD